MVLTLPPRSGKPRRPAGKTARRFSAGFSLVELLVAITIMVILAGAVGLKLIDMPEHIRQKALWVRAVNDAWRECREDDKQLAYLFEHNFRLTGDILGPEHNTAVRARIMEELNISRPTFYNWLEAVADILVYHATKRKLL